MIFSSLVALLSRGGAVMGPFSAGELTAFPSCSVNWSFISRHFLPCASLWRACSSWEMWTILDLAWFGLEAKLMLNRSHKKEMLFLNQLRQQWQQSWSLWERDTGDCFHLQANISKAVAVRWTMKAKHKINLLEREYSMQTCWWALPLRQSASEMPQALPWEEMSRSSSLPSGHQNGHFPITPWGPAACTVGDPEVRYSTAYISRAANHRQNWYFTMLLKLASLCD